MYVFLSFLLILIIIVFVYARYIEPYQMEVKNVYISNDLGLKILQISDIHYGKNFNAKQLRDLVTMINKEDKDIVVFTGDFFDDKYKGEISEISNILNKIDCDYKFSINGNHDYKHYANIYYNDLMMKSNFKLLVNDNVHIKLNDIKLNIIGSDDFINGNPDIKGIKKLVDNSFNLLLLHTPDMAVKFTDSKFDLILSGHSHGGQVRLNKYIGISNRLGRVYRDGLYNLNNTKLYVSSGIGTSGLRLRLRVKPSFTIISI